MKVHQFARAAFWEQHQQHDSPPHSLLTLGCNNKRLRPLAPKLATTTTTAADSLSVSSFDLKTFIRPESGPRKLDDKRNSPSPQVETQPGGTRWNPTQEQIGILEMLYRGGMRTPNAQQIEQITAQLGKYGKIEGKNVFYWFQNHKARERQKQKRNSLGLNHFPRSISSCSTTTSTTTTSTPVITAINLDNRVEAEKEEDSPYKRKCRSWSFECMEDDNNRSSCRDQETGDRTLELFPLHPEGRSS